MNSTLDLKELFKQIKKIEESRDMMRAMQKDRDNYVKDLLAWIAGSKTIIKNTILIISNGARAVEKTRNPLFGINALETAYKTLSPLSRAAANYGVSITNNLNRLLDSFQQLDVELIQLKSEHPEITQTADLLIDEINMINLLISRYKNEETKRLAIAMRTISKWNNIRHLAPQNFNDFIMSLSDSIPALQISTTISDWKRMRTLPWDHVVATLTNLQRQLEEFLVEYDAAIDITRLSIQETDVFIKKILSLCDSLIPQSQEIFKNLQGQKLL